MKGETIMQARRKRTAQQHSPEPAPRQHPREKVSEMGQEEQGSRIHDERAAGNDPLRENERLEQHHGGTPPGSDPRE